jgi:hypothetical protein
MELFLCYLLEDSHHQRKPEVDVSHLVLVPLGFPESS